MDGGGNFRANFGMERNGVNLLAEDGSASKGAEIQTGYPEFDHVLLKKLGWWGELTDAEKAAAEGKNWKTDPSGGIIRVTMKNHGCHVYGNAKARALVWNFPDGVPQSPSTRRTTTRRPSGACPRCTRRCRTRTSPRRWPRNTR
jgi:formate dehydrogenase major subunit